MILLTLLLSETTAISFGMLLLIALVVLVLLIPVFLLSWPRSTWKYKPIALGLALLPIWLSSGLVNEFRYMDGSGLVLSLVSSFFHLPLAIAVINIVLSVIKESKKA